MKKPKSCRLDTVCGHSILALALTATNSRLSLSLLSHKKDPPSLERARALFQASLDMGCGDAAVELCALNDRVRFWWWQFTLQRLVSIFSATFLSLTHTLTHISASFCLSLPPSLSFS